VCDRSIKVFFDVEKLMAEDFIQEIERVLPGIEDRMHVEEKKEERCQSSVEINKGLNGKNALVY
jgi:predicted transposase YdaD